MRFGLAAGMTALLMVMVSLLPAPVRAEAVETGEEALMAVASIDEGFTQLHNQLLRKAPRVTPDEEDT